MPTRLIDGEALWHSTKMRNVPLKFRAEYANLIPLAEADGTFLADTRTVWSRVYSDNREDITVEMVGEMLDAFEKAGMFSRKTDESGRVWGHFNGIEKRLPPESIRDRYKQGNLDIFNELEEKVRPIKTLSRPTLDRKGVGMDWNRKGIGKEDSTNGQDAFKSAKKIFRRNVGISFGSLGNRADQWNELARQHGVDVLVEAVEMYSRELGKAGRGLGYPLAHFLKNSEEFIEAIVESKQKTEPQIYQIKDAPDPFEIAPDPDALSPEEILANKDKI